LELNNPPELIVQTFTFGAIEAFRVLAACLSIISLIVTLSLGLYQYYAIRNEESAPTESTPLM